MYNAGMVGWGEINVDVWMTVSRPVIVDFAVIRTGVVCCLRLSRSSCCAFTLMKFSSTGRGVR